MINIKNKVQLIGKICDPKISTTESNLKVANFSIYVNQAFYNHEGELRNELMIHKCKAYGELAEILDRNYIRRVELGIEGFLVTSSYKQSGWTVFVNHVEVRELVFLNKKPNNI